MLTDLNFLSDSENDGGVLPHPGHLLELLDFPQAMGEYFLDPGNLLPRVNTGDRIMTETFVCKNVYILYILLLLLFLLCLLFIIIKSIMYMHVYRM